MSFQDVLSDINNIYSVSTKISDKTQKHSFIQCEVCNLASKYKCIGKIEYRIKEAYLTKAGAVRIGYIDVVWFYGDVIMLAFEIDSIYRNKSVAKLEKVEAKYKVWLCYDSTLKYRFKKKTNINYILPFYNLY